MQQLDWTVDAGPSNVASTLEPAGRSQTRRLREGIEYHGRTGTREAKTDSGDPAFLGWHPGRRIAPAALRRLRQRLLSAAPLLPGLRLPQGQRVQGQRQG